MNVKPVFKDGIPWSGVIKTPDPLNRFWGGWHEGKLICSTGSKEVCEQYLRKYLEGLDGTK